MPLVTTPDNSQLIAQIEETISNIIFPISLRTLQDVSFPVLSDGYAVKYSSSIDKFVLEADNPGIPDAPTAENYFRTLNNWVIANFGNLEDVLFSSPTVGQIVEYDGSKWINSNSQINQAAQITQINADIQTIDDDINTIVDTINTIEAEQTVQNNRITDAENLILNLQNEDISINGRLDNLEAEQITQNSSISANSSNIGIIQTEQTTQNNRLDIAETDILALQSQTYNLNDLTDVTISAPILNQII